MITKEINKELSIYFHWPFCLSKCPYCDFMSVPAQPNEELFKLYGELLIKDLKQSLEQANFLSSQTKIKTIFFGGGTPSLMSAKSIENILDFIRTHYQLNNDDDIEISLEANPATFDLQKMRDFKTAGINRISLGVQSFSDKNLSFLGRIYNSKQVYDAAEIVASVFTNFSFDFMYGYKCQKIDSLKKDLQTAMDFNCKHISCYQLTFENNTLFYKQLLSGEKQEISDEKGIQFYDFIENFLKDYNINRYEISNYSVKNFECKHNLCYWKYNDYLGIGSSAHGRLKINGNKYATEKIHDPCLWAEAINNSDNAYSVYYELTDHEKIEEMLIMGLRITDGILWSDIYSEISKNSTDNNNVVDNLIDKNKLNFLERNNLIISDDKGIHLTKSGFLKINSVIEFLCS